MSKAIQITTPTFEQTVEKGIVLLDFWAPWCGPCRVFAPVFERAAQKHPDVVFGKINTDEEQELASAFDIQAIPTLMAFRDGIPVFAQPGMLPAAALDELVQKVRALDMTEVRRKVQEAQKEHAGARS